MPQGGRRAVAVRRSPRHLRCSSSPDSLAATPPQACPVETLTAAESHAIRDGPDIPRPTKRRRTTSYSDGGIRRRDRHLDATCSPHCSAAHPSFPILCLPDDLLREVVQRMWGISERATKHNMRMVCHKFQDLTSALASRMSLSLHAFLEFVDNRTRRNPFMLRLPSTFPNVHALTLENGLPDFMKPPVSTSRCRQAARLFLSKVVSRMDSLRELDLKNWPGRRLSQADVQLLVKACPRLQQLKLMTYDDKHTLFTLAQLPSLQNLYIVRSPDQDEDMVALSGFTQLTSLHLGFITDEQNVILSMTQLTSLVSFDVDILLLRDQAAVSMAQLKSLTRLHLGILSPDEASLEFSESLKALTNLEDVGLRQYTGCCNTRVLEALASLPRLRTLQLNPSQFVRCTRKCNPFTALTKLELQRTTVDSHTLDGIGLGGALPQLAQLILHSCKVLHAGPVLSVISKQVHLRSLFIHEVDDVVSAASLMQLSKLTLLQQLYFVSKHQAQLPGTDSQQSLLVTLPQLRVTNDFKFSFSVSEAEGSLPFTD